MEYGYSILMGLFSVALLIYAALMAVTRDYNILPYRAQISVSPKDPELYMARLSECVALIALAPALSALIGLWNKPVALVVLVAGIVFFLWLSVRIMQDFY